MFNQIISPENLLEAWQEFIKGKRQKHDVQLFQFSLMDTILSLHADLQSGAYQHGGYHAFNISDPKPRNIHKATVRDRVLHHAVYRVLYPLFDKKFIHDSYSCRNKKGTQKALNRFRKFGYKVSKNNTRTCWVLKCDIRKFFASIDHDTLFRVMERHIAYTDAIRLIKNIVESFHTKQGRGLPLGNLTSQLLVNIYMNEFDQFVKHKLHFKYYIRYADDFVFFSENKQLLEGLLLKIGEFLETELKLSLHPDKVFIKTLASGIDFLGWVHFPDHRVLRTATKRRMMKRIAERPVDATIQSYLGMLRHGNARKLSWLVLGDI